MGREQRIWSGGIVLRRFLEGGIFGLFVWVSKHSRLAPRDGWGIEEKGKRYEFYEVGWRGIVIIERRASTFDIREGILALLLLRLNRFYFRFALYHVATRQSPSS